MQRQEATTYLKAITIRDPGDMDQIREDVARGMVLILRVTPLATRDVSKLRALVADLYDLAGEKGYDIARLGEERIIVTPSRIKIWKPEHALK